MKKRSLMRVVALVAFVAAVIGLSMCASRYAGIESAKEAAERQRRLDGMLRPSAMSEIRVGDRFSPYGLIGPNEVLQPETLHCEMDESQDSIVVEKIVDDMARMRYAPQYPSAHDGSSLWKECPVGTVFMAELETLLVWKRLNEEKKAHRRHHDEMRKVLKKP